VVLVIVGKSTDAARSDEEEEYRFTRWVVLPGADDKEPKAQNPGGNPGGG
jgi:hypothetical protein